MRTMSEKFIIRPSCDFPAFISATASYMDQGIKFSNAESKYAFPAPDRRWEGKTQ
jgi:hypothetical protein